MYLFLTTVFSAGEPTPDDLKIVGFIKDGDNPCRKFEDLHNAVLIAPNLLIARRRYPPLETALSFWFNIEFSSGVESIEDNDPWIKLITLSKTTKLSPEYLTLRTDIREGFLVRCISPSYMSKNPSKDIFHIQLYQPPKDNTLPCLYFNPKFFEKGSLEYFGAAFFVKNNDKYKFYGIYARDMGKYGVIAPIESALAMIHFEQDEQQKRRVIHEEEAQQRTMTLLALPEFCSFIQKVKEQKKDASIQEEQRKKVAEEQKEKRLAARKKAEAFDASGAASSGFRRPEEKPFCLKPQQKTSRLAIEGSSHLAITQGETGDLAMPKKGSMREREKEIERLKSAAAVASSMASVRSQRAIEGGEVKLLEFFQPAPDASKEEDEESNRIKSLQTLPQGSSLPPKKKEKQKEKLATQIKKTAIHNFWEEEPKELDINEYIKLIGILSPEGQKPQEQKPKDKPSPEEGTKIYTIIEGLAAKISPILKDILDKLGEDSIYTDLVEELCTKDSSINGKVLHNKDIIPRIWKRACLVVHPDKNPDSGPSFIKLKALVDKYLKSEEDVDDDVKVEIFKRDVDSDDEKALKDLGAQ